MNMNGVHQFHQYMVVGVDADVDVVVVGVDVNVTQTEKLSLWIFKPFLMTCMPMQRYRRPVGTPGTSRICSVRLIALHCLTTRLR